ncbi:Ribosome biogenesis GTPase Lsg1, putative [Penicillium digitatum]|uniref:Ribosome biogenesis GTPase Lsg1, putative n=3 Tax=Penicillium digitatum TaxID=36651 RepID=K9FQY5_PEND2|nr:Ribosome biogenesis GTPase Lsg1, putative [Penicillium digitatum Pd1]EKV10792.1 Ribosome biogenesis GTPase Lsg1, putative [Penicillium digitatum PHI26]EKV13136.1 Ribosome biogenesis GTPase Lsg1, putative [Penicillium digitatum Pd1]QQK43445.1 Ribosome biogenesis GTPase Lsg1, putative [Penicillium digitatum]
MVLAKSKKSVGLGASLMNDRFGKGKASSQKKVSHNNAIQRTGVNGETYVTNEAKEASWVKMRSITEQAALDEFLSTAELAGTDFTAEKINNVKIIHSDQKNPFLLTPTEEKKAFIKHQKNKDRLTVPRRPKWDQSTTRNELETMEKQSLLDWRRGLAELVESHDLLMTPFERNLEVWRQLWRVIERSDLIVQIVDARNPLQFRSEDLESYVKEIDPRKQNLLLVNKADMLSLKQREAWAEYFEKNNINFRFFSAHLAKEKNEALALQEEGNDSDAELAQSVQKINVHATEDDGYKKEETVEEERAKLADPRRSLGPHILDTEELEELFLANSPESLPHDDESGETKRKTTIGLVGYPNVGKSSTINALLGAKKVSVSATPGKTKHFQTLYLSPEIMLCDCPGLVFPNFATTKAELVVNGVLPIDQQREFTGPAGIVAKRIPKHFIEQVYGVKLRMRPIEEGGTGVPTASEILRAYARARGFSTQGIGQPDESRAARYVLKDYINGKLLWVNPPPVAEDETPIDTVEFNSDLYDLAHLPERRRAQLTQAKVGKHSAVADVAAGSAGDVDLESPSGLTKISVEPELGRVSRNLDTGFFGSETGPSAGRLTLPFQSRYTQQGQEMRKAPTGRKERMMVALERGVDVSEVKGNIGSKKHFKANKRLAKSKRNNPEDDDY